jgi:quercetin dioxygenase-like cupin family protein
MANETSAQTHAYHADYSAAKHLRPEAFTPTIIGQGEHLRAMLVCFEPGQFIPVHAPKLDLTLIVLEGEGQLVLGEETVPLRSGSVAFIPAGEKRGVKAETRLTAFQVVSPVPGEADHAGVKAGLERGTWR